MSRSYAKVYRDIWSDTDFTSQPAAAQYLYLFLLSQPNLNAAGVLPLTVRRWATAAGRVKPEHIEGDLAILASRRYVVTDYDTEELLIRSYVRNDGLWRIPNTLRAVIRDAERVASPELRQALSCELRQLPVDELTGVKAEEMKLQVRKIAVTLGLTLSSRVAPTVALRVDPSPANQIFTFDPDLPGGNSETAGKNG